MQEIPRLWLLRLCREERQQAFLTPMKTNDIRNTDKPTLAGRAPVGSENKFNPAPLADAEFCRLPNPRRGRCPVSGLSRSALIDLGVTVPGLLVRLRKPGAVRGAVLMHLPTLRQYLRDMREAQLKREGEGNEG